MFKLKRIYEKTDRGDGFRILVDRLWPRGVSKEEARIDLWIREVAPSTELRKWFGHDPKKWAEFEARYRQELEKKRQLLDQLISLEKKHKIVTLLYAAKDTEHNQAVVLVKKLTQ